MCTPSSALSSYNNTLALARSQGRRPTPKAEIIALYEAGHDEVAIARHSNHAQSSVGKYIHDYERVKLLLTQRIPVAQINRLSQCSPT